MLRTLVVAILATASFHAKLHAQAVCDVEDAHCQKNPAMRPSLPPVISGPLRPVPLEAIPIPPIPNAPFTATVVTVRTHVHPLSDVTITTENHYLVARDSAGRVFEEHRGFTHGGDKHETYLFNTEISDPKHNVLYRCDPQTRSCQTLPFGVHVGVDQPAPGNSVKKTVDLGQKKIDNLDTTGSREVIDIDTSNGIGKRSVESWFSPQLQINLLQKYSGSKSDAVDITVKNLVLAEPNPGLFRLPSGYKLLPAEQTSLPIAPK